MIQAASGRKASWPVAELAVNTPMTRPRRAVNQRLATTAPSTSAVMPVPKPSTTPQRMNKCQSCVACVASAMPMPTIARPVNITARRP